MQTSLLSGRPGSRGLLSLVHPSKELFQRQRALLHHPVFAGYPSSCEDGYAEHFPKLDDHLVRQKESTFFMRVTGDSMRGMGIFDGDLLVVDRALPATHGCVVIAVANGGFTVRQLLLAPQGRVLRAAHPDYADQPIKPEQDFSIWGVVQWNVHKMQTCNAPSELT